MDDLDTTWFLVYSISLIAFVAILLPAVVVPAVFGAVALFARSRETAFARYPLRVMTWVIVTPVFVGALVIAFGSLLTVGRGRGVDPSGLLAIGANFATLPLCVLAVVMCSRAATGQFERGPWTPAVLGFLAPLLVTPFVVSFTGPWALIVTVVISVSAGVNGLLAVPINGRRRAAKEQETAARPLALPHPPLAVPDLRQLPE